MKVCFMCRLNVKKTIEINGECGKSANILSIILKHFWFAVSLCGSIKHFLAYDGFAIFLGRSSGE